MSADPSRHHTGPRHDAAVFVGGLLVFIASFLPWYRVTVQGGPAESGVTGSVNAWHGLAGIGLIVLLVSVVVTAAEPFIGEDLPPLVLPLVAAVVACAGAALVVIRSLSLPGAGIPAATTRLSWGGWTLIVLVILQAMLSVLRAVHANDPRPEGPVVPDVPSG